jgi:formate-dependent nitrite reductase membrane component NrfD
MTELDIARHVPNLDPHLHVWGWEIPVYLFLGGMAAGAMILTALMSAPRGARPGPWGGVAAEDRSPSGRLLPLLAPVLVSLGMAALFLDLANKLNVWRFYLAFRWTSPMSWGAWILLVVYPVTLLHALASLEAGEAERLAARAGPLAGRRCARSSTTHAPRVGSSPAASRTRGRGSSSGRQWSAACRTARGWCARSSSDR